MDHERFDVRDVLLLKPRTFDDERGFFREQFKASTYHAFGLPPFVQDNHSRSSRHVLRGLHYQLPPAAQGKLVTCIRGEILDVAVDLRRSSPSFGRWVSAVLSDENGHQLWVPPGFAHGFLVRSEVADVVYKCTAEYAGELDRALRWDDPEVGIDWGVAEPVLSEKDRNAPRLVDAEVPFTYEAERETEATR